MCKSPLLLCIVLSSFVFVFSCREKQKLSPYSWRPEVDSLINDTISVNPVFDSLRTLFHQSETEKERIVALSKLSEELFSPVASILLSDAERLAVITNETAALADVISHQGLIALREQNLRLSDSLLRVSLSMIHDKSTNEIRVRNYLWLGEIFRLKGSFDSALVYLDSSIALATQGKLYRRLSAAYLSKGLIFQQLSESTMALTNWNQAMNFADLSGSNSAIADVFRAKADLYKIMGNDVEALNQFNKSIRFASLDKNLRLLTFCHLGISDIFIKRNDIQNAQKELSLAKSFSSRLSNKTLLLTAMIKEAELQMIRNEYGTALNITDSALIVSQKFNLKKKEAHCLSILGDISLSLNNPFEAVEYYQKAYDLAKLSGDRNIESYSLNRLGSIRLSNENVLTAKARLEESLKIALSTKTDNDIINASYSLSKIYKELGSYEKALGMFILFHQTQQRNDNGEVRKRLDKLYFDNQRERDAYFSKMRSIQMNNDLLYEKRIRNFFVVVMVLLSVLVFLIFRGYLRKKKVNSILESKNRLIEEQKAETVQSIQYAKRIQESMLYSFEEFSHLINDFFVLYKPKDIVSGDFYSFFEKDDSIIVVCADCTGHGVPGALMSVLGKSLLSQIINEKGITEPSQILSQLNQGIILALNQKATSGNDGMDVAIVQIKKSANGLLAEFCGANRPLFILRNGKVNEIKGNKNPIGGHHSDINQLYLPFSLNLESGDRLFLTTDGFLDQFGGPDNKKLMRKRFIAEIESMAELPFKKYQQRLDDFFLSYKGLNEQIDDVCVLGLMI
jgi:serine phosphatase RsbU (regulator of sigma subunit)